MSRNEPSALEADTHISDAHSYQIPPAEIADVVLAPLTPVVGISPDGHWMMQLVYCALPSIADVVRPKLRLAGMRIDPDADARFTPMFGEALSLRPLRDGDTVAVPLPDGAKIIGVSWAPDGSRFAVMLTTGVGSELWIGPSAHPDRARCVTRSLHLVTGGVSWTADASSVLCHLVPQDRGAPPAKPRTPTGPNVQETTGQATPLRTHQDLLSSEADAVRWEYYATSDLALVDLATGEVQVLHRGIFTQASLSPDSEWILTARAMRPYSYTMPHWMFPHRVEVARVAQPDRTIVAWDIPAEEGIPLHGVPDCPRSMQWAKNEPATLHWVEALDGGDPKAKVEHRDRWMSAKAPFQSNADGTASATERLRLQHRATRLSYFEAPGLVLAGEYDRDRRWLRQTVFDLDGDAGPRVIDDRNISDRYGSLGSPITQCGPYGRRVIRQDGRHILRSGQGASKSGDRPRLCRQSLDTLEVEELWRCGDDAYEYVAALLDDGTLVTRHESVTSPPNYYLHQHDSDSREPLTAFPDPQPSLRGITKERLTYERSDGVRLTGTLYLPEDYEPGTRLPLVIWGYPIEYDDDGTAGQIQGTTKRFTRLGGASHLLLVTQGYAVLDNATMPVVGDPETVNNTFNEQIVASAQAAIDACVARGVADRDRVGVAGHSYGASMAASLLAHCDLFRAGIARSGAYNRTLTPFGFQRERRTLWEAPDAYLSLSPLLLADKITAPLLLIHGEDDSNAGTYPLQSRRLYLALQGHGQTARLVMLPGEGHGYMARESVLHVLYEMVAWFDQHVKHAQL